MKLITDANNRRRVLTTRLTCLYLVFVLTLELLLGLFQILFVAPTGNCYSLKHCAGPSSFLGFRLKESIRK